MHKSKSQKTPARLCIRRDELSGSAWLEERSFAAPEESLESQTADCTRFLAPHPQDQGDAHVVHERQGFPRVSDKRIPKYQNVRKSKLLKSNALAPLAADWEARRKRRIIAAWRFLLA